MRFAFYGRVSTEDQQDPTSSRNWQLAGDQQLIEPTAGEIVGEFFDLGQSRSLPWPRRPEAARLLKALADHDRGFDAVVIGEPQRAFYGNQFGLTFPVFVHYGVQLWVPEVGGAGRSRQRRPRDRHVALRRHEQRRTEPHQDPRPDAMEAQVAIEGRFQGGRPPFGYRLADAGAHPNPSKANDGRRLHRLEPDPMTAPIVRRIFTEFVAGKGLHAIASMLTAEGILSPGASDPGRNPHRAKNGPGWRHTAVRVILKNPATSATRSGTVRSATRYSSTSTTSRSVTTPACAGTTKTTGSTPKNKPTNHSSPTSCGTRRKLPSMRSAAQPTGPRSKVVTTRSPVSCAAGSAAGAWKAPGTTTSPTTAARFTATTPSTATATRPRST